MAEYIECRRCDSPDCKGCNLKRLETMLKNGKFDCLMNENRSINTSYDVETVRHGRWIEHEETQEDAYSHHKCSECNVNAPFYYKMLDDWDEGMDGEWYSIGLVDDGINEYLTDYCPNCGASMDGGSN